MKDEIRTQEQDISYEISKAIDRIIDDEYSRTAKYLGKIARFSYRFNVLELPIVNVDCDLIDSKWRLIFYFDLPEHIEGGVRSTRMTSDDIVFV